MRVVDLHDVELLHDLVVDLDLARLEGRDDLLAEVDGQDVMQLVQRLNLLVSLKIITHLCGTYDLDLIDHGVCIRLHEHRLHR